MRVNIRLYHVSICVYYGFICFSSEPHAILRSCRCYKAGSARSSKVQWPQRRGRWRSFLRNIMSRMWVGLPQMWDMNPASIFRLRANSKTPVSCVTHVTRERSELDTGSERPVTRDRGGGKGEGGECRKCERKKRMRGRCTR